MKTYRDILVPTDFSPCALSALRLAIAWHSVEPIRVHVYHRVAGMPVHWNDMTEGEQDLHTGVVHAIDSLHKSFDHYKTVMRDRGVPCKLVYSGGDLGDSIASYVDLENIDYIFMGSHGKEGKEVNKLGSNAIEVLRRVSIPVLTAKEDSRHFKMDNLVFASNFDLAALDAFEQLLDIVKPFDPVIHFLNIDAPTFFHDPRFVLMNAIQDFRDRAGEFNTKTHFHQEATVGKGIVSFCGKLDADLVVLSESANRLFGKKKIAKPVKFLIENSSQPVLFIQPRMKPTFMSIDEE